MRYKTRSLAVQAVRLRCADINNDYVIDGPLLNQQPTPEWVLKAFDEKLLRLHRKSESDWAHISVSVLGDDDDVVVGPGDYIVAVNGRVFPCHADLFDTLFEKDEEDGA